MLSPIKESRRENGSNQELRCSPERWSITSASPTHSASSDINGAFGYSPKLSAKPNINNRTGSLERYHIVYEENGTRYKAIKRVPITNQTSNFTNESLADDTMETSAPTSKSTYLLENGVKKKGSSRIRYNIIFGSNDNGVQKVIYWILKALKIPFYLAYIHFNT